MKTKIIVIKPKTSFLEKIINYFKERREKRRGDKWNPSKSDIGFSGYVLLFCLFSILVIDIIEMVCN